MDKELTREDHKREAKRYLEAARGGGIADGCIEQMREHLKQGKWTLADIGTSEDDLKTVMRNRSQQYA